MAGPGGGPPRKSHTKSRKGCRTCKRRHIRCDESFPQCRNCTKHSVRCDYMDMPAAGEEPMRGSRPAELLTSPELQQVLDTWRLSGEPPLSILQVNDPTYWMRFSTIDLRLIHHITTLSLDLHRRNYSSCTPWAPKMLTLIQVALSSDFAMSAVLAFSASNLAWQTKNQDTENLAYHHRGIALKGLHEAIGAFSEQNSEVILAVSMLLSWQATEWRTWASLQQGVATVMNIIRPWVHKSELASYVEAQQSVARARTPSTPSMNGQSPLTNSEDLRRVEHITTALRSLRLRLVNHEELVDHVDDLLTYLQRMQQDFPLQSPEDAFEHLQYLRAVLFWLPPAILRSGESDLGAIAMLAHFFALALVLEPLFPDIGDTYLGNMSLQPIENMHDMLLARRNSTPQDTSVQVALSLLDTPMQIINQYKAQQRVMAPPTDLYRSVARSPYGMPPVPQLSSEISGGSLYSGTSITTPTTIQVGAASYLTSSPSTAPLGLDSRGYRVPERTLSSNSSMSPYGQDHTDWKSHVPTGVDYFANGSGPYQQHPGSHPVQYRGSSRKSASGLGTPLSSPPHHVSNPIGGLMTTTNTAEMLGGRAPRRTYSYTPRSLQQDGSMDTGS